MDERMTSSNLDLAWPPPCEQCSGHAETSRPQEHGYEGGERAARGVGQGKLPESQNHEEPIAACHTTLPHFTLSTHSGQMNRPHPAAAWPPGLRQPYQQDHMVYPSQGFANPSSFPQERSVEEAESLEPPFPLMSEVNCTQYVPPRHLGARMPGQCVYVLIFDNLLQKDDRLFDVYCQINDTFDHKSHLLISRWW